MAANWEGFASLEGLGGVLGGLGLFGIVAGLALAFIVGLVLPWWAIIDCALSRRSNGVKAVAIVLLVITWGLGSIVYGLCLASSKVMRVVTVVAVLGVTIFLGAGVASLLGGAAIHGREQAEAKRRERQQLESAFQPASIAPSAVAGFHALHFTLGDTGPRAAAVARFTLAGPEANSARDTDRTVRHAAFDAEGQRWFALTAHEFGTLSSTSGRFTKIDVDPALTDFAWPKGVAYDAVNKQVYVLTSHVHTHFFRYDPNTSAWERLPTEIRDLPLVGLAHSARDGSLYALELPSSAMALRRVHRFNSAGASLGAVELWPPIPLSDGYEDLLQIAESDGRLVVLLPPAELRALRVAQGATAAAPNRIFVIDPASGQVFRPGDAR